MDGVDSATWRTASYSGNSGNCVEAGDGGAGRVLVRDTADRAVTLAVPADAWEAFLGTLR
jgi:hypothetical protein